jgi:hypothetical protein
MKIFMLFRKRIFTLFIYLLTASATLPAITSAQEDSLDEMKKKAIRVYLDCSDCDFDYLRKELTFVNYVRDRNDAQVYILVTTQKTGGGGTEYTVAFLGKQEFEGINDTLTFIMKKTDTDDSTRKELLRTLKLGLIRYASKTPLADKLTISFQETAKSDKVVDKWDYWVFSIGSYMYASGEQLYKYKSISWSASANRITEDMKINLALSFNYSDNNYKVDEENILSVQRSRNFKSLVVFSLSDHWSWGGSASYYHSTYSNMDYYLAAGPALEYNLFPYSESTRRQMRFLYKINYNYAEYLEETIYDKNCENLFDQSLTISFNMKEPWGSSGISVGGSHYFHDANKYSLTLSGSLSFYLIEGLSLDLYGNYSRIHNQLSLPKQGADRDETLLRIRQLETNYDYFFMVGLSYTFGSIYNNIVNPRFGSSSSGTSISISY